MPVLQAGKYVMLQHCRKFTGCIVVYGKHKTLHVPDTDARLGYR